MIGYLLAVLIGLSLGLLGGGGSILTVPILVYVISMPPKLSIALSLAIVGITSLVGVIGHFRNKNVEVKVALIFGPFAILGTYSGTKISQYLSGEAQMILFAIIMLAASIFMLKGRKESLIEEFKFTPIKVLLIGSQAIIVGIITGIVGVGGGFLIVPALTFVARISLKKAIGTSLVLITINSLTGFVSYMGTMEIPWEFLAKFSFFSIIGVLAGNFFVKHIPQATLKKVFAIFLLLMAIFILFKNYFIF